MHCIDMHHIGFKMEGVVDVVYYDGDMVSTSKGILFEYSNNTKFIKTNEEMLHCCFKKNTYRCH